MTETPELVKGPEEQLQECDLCLLSQAVVTPVKTKRHEYIPCDIDTSVMNTRGRRRKIENSNGDFGLAAPITDMSVTRQGIHHLTNKYMP
jgi:hypothetical protein